MWLFSLPLQDFLLTYFLLRKPASVLFGKVRPYNAVEQLFPLPHTGYTARTPQGCSDNCTVYPLRAIVAVTISATVAATTVYTDDTVYLRYLVAGDGFLWHSVPSQSIFHRLIFRIRQTRNICLSSSPLIWSASSIFVSFDKIVIAVTWRRFISCGWINEFYSIVFQHAFYTGLSKKVSVAANIQATQT